MAKPLRVIGMVAGVVALSIALPGVGTALGISAATAATVGAVATAVSTAAMAGAQALQKPPEARGTISEVVIGANMPVPYVMGRTYVGGFKVYDDSTGGPDNWERTQIFVGSHAGPIDSFEKFLADYSQITVPISGGRLEGHASGFYADYLTLNSRLGLRPDTALAATGGRDTFDNWGASHKLSGMACWSVTMEFDEDGKRWASGVPAFGVVANWVKAYDPRLDSSYPGGSGSHDWDDESTWAWTDNPGLHALTYARGRFMGANAVKVAGCGVPKESIDLAAFVELANACEANDWTLGGAVYEAPGISKWDNLKRICDAAAAKPLWSGGVLTLAISAPKVALDTVTKDDLVEGEAVFPAMAPWKGKFNTIVPRYRSEAHRWEYVQAEAVSSATYVTEDGETKTDERQYDLIQDVDQAAQRAAYDLVNEREYGPVQLTVKPRLRLYRSGEALELDLASILDDDDLGTQTMVIVDRAIDPATSAVTLALMSETAAKHAFALGLTGVAPPTPTLVTPEEVDEGVAGTDPSLYEITPPPVVTILANYTGAVLAGQLPRPVQMQLLRGAEDVTAEATWGMTTVSGSITASIGAATGLVTITNIVASSVLQVTATIGGIVKTSTLQVNKQIGVPPVGGSSGAPTVYVTVSDSIASASMSPVSDELLVTAGAAGEVQLSANLDVWTDETFPLGTFPVLGQWEWFNDGTSAWEALGSETESDPDAQYASGAVLVQGALGVSHLKTGLTDGNNYRFRLAARNSSGTRTMYLSGSASGVGG